MRTIDVPSIGVVRLRKSNRAKRLILRITHDGKPEVVLPKYAPYALARQFAARHSKWINKQQSLYRPTVLTPGKLVGRSHSITFVPTATSSISSRVQNDIITVKHPSSLETTDDKVQDVAQRALLRALKKEAWSYLPSLLNDLSKKHNYTYASVNVKNMRSRWGSCSSTGAINLNIWLMQLPDELIEYVCCHELVHLNHPHHQKSFWDELAYILPDYADRRQQLRSHGPRLV